MLRLARWLIRRSATQQNLISFSAAMLALKEQPVLRITMCCEMTRSSQQMSCSLSQIICATLMQAALARCRSLLLHTTPTSWPTALATMSLLVPTWRQRRPPADSSASAPANGPKPLPAIKDELKGSMFYY